MSRNADNAATTVIDPVHLQMIERLYTITDYRQVRRFLEEHAFLPSLIIDVFDDINTYFPGTRYILQVVHDPDEEDPSAADVLVIYIATELDPPQALDRFDALEHAWWSKVQGHDSGKLYLNLTFT